MVWCDSHNKKHTSHGGVADDGVVDCRPQHRGHGCRGGADPLMDEHQQHGEHIWDSESTECSHSDGDMAMS